MSSSLMQKSGVSLPPLSTLGRTPPFTPPPLPPFRPCGLRNFFCSALSSSLHEPKITEIDHELILMDMFSLLGQSDTPMLGFRWRLLRPERLANWLIWLCQNEPIWSSFVVVVVVVVVVDAEGVCVCGQFTCYFSKWLPYYEYYCLHLEDIGSISICLIFMIQVPPSGGYW